MDQKEGLDCRCQRRRLATPRQEYPHRSPTPLWERHRRPSRHKDRRRASSTMRAPCRSGRATCRVAPGPRREHSGLGGGGCSAGREDRTVRESPLKDNLRYLAERAVQKVASGDRPLEYFAGATALYDTRRDQAITELPAFENARIALGAVSVVQ